MPNSSTIFRPAPLEHQSASCCILRPYEQYQGFATEGPLERRSRHSPGEINEMGQGRGLDGLARAIQWLV